MTDTCQFLVYKLRERRLVDVIEDGLSVKRAVFNSTAHEV